MIQCGNYVSSGVQTMLIWFVSKTATESQSRCEIPHWEHRNRGWDGGTPKSVVDSSAWMQEAVEATNSMLRKVQLEENGELQQDCSTNISWLRTDLWLTCDVTSVLCQSAAYVGNFWREA